ncbi:MAG TPA: ABC transporter permease [bacterium]|nr:ABC transporter permease [bacterium]
MSVPQTAGTPRWVRDQVVVGRLRYTVSRVRRNPIGITGAVIILATVLVAIAGPWVWRVDYASQASHRLLAPSPAHPMGTDELGRDELARVIHGASVSLQVGIVAVVIASVIGSAVGIAAGFYGGRADAILMRFIDIMFAIPVLVLAILIAGLLGPSRTNAMIAIGIVYSSAFARVVRGSTLTIMSLPHVEAARSLGAVDLRIIVRHLVPNLIAPLMVLVTVYLSTAILTEATLSFLGLGTQPPEPSWGSMLNAARSHMELAPWLAVFPGLAIMLVVLGFNFLGDGLRDVLDPRLGEVQR